MSNNQQEKIAFQELYDEYVKSCEGYEDCTPMSHDEYLADIIPWMIEQGYKISGDVIFVREE